MLAHLLPEQPIDFIEIYDEKEDHRWVFDLSFMMSNWSCIYGNGCTGIHHSNSPTYAVEAGCCALGCWITEPEDLESTEKHYAMLSDEDWDSELRSVANKKGDWKVTYAKRFDEDGNLEEVNVRSRVHEGICIFSNRKGNSSGKIGCAFHALANRLGVSHVETKPNVCWQLPLHVIRNADTTTIYRWDRRTWEGYDEDGSQEWLNWWCIDSPDAYQGTQPVYKYMEQEIRKVCGDEIYSRLCAELEKRKDNYIAPMPGTLANSGQPLLPLVMVNKKPIR